MGRRWKGPTIEWSYAWEETNNILHEDLYYCIRSGRMSGIFVSGKNFPITKISIFWRLWWHSKPPISRETSDIVLTCTWVCKAWVALRAGNPSPSGLATLNRQSTCHGPRPGAKLAHGVRTGSLRATEPRARGKTGGRKIKKCRKVKKTYLYIYIQGSGVAAYRRPRPPR